METPNKKYIYFVRHGESTANVSGIRQGPDSVLTNKGVTQAEVVGKRLARLPIEIILSSTYKRAEQTAKAIQKNVPKDIIYSDLVVERKNPSRSIGKSHTDPDWRSIFEDIDANYGNFDWSFEDSESGGQLLQRAREALEFIVSQPQDHILVVTHGMFLRFIAYVVLCDGKLEGKDFLAFIKTFRTNNTGISILEYDQLFDYGSPWAIRVWNDHEHIIEILDPVTTDELELPESKK